MSEIIKVNSVTAYNKLRSVKTLHPLVSVIDASMAEPMPAGTYNFSVYGVFLKELKCGELRYGRSNYDYQEGTLVFFGPGQVLGVPGNHVKSKGWGLIFHPDLIKGTPLGKDIYKYNYFSYDVNEALHISEDEKELVIDQMIKIQHELGRSLDHHSNRIITTSIELLLSYFTRFYDRQFITRDKTNKGILEKFEQLLISYFKGDGPQQQGFPTVNYFARELNLSPNYFGDLIKKETGMSPLEHIQSKVIDIAKERVFDMDKSIAEVGYELGFKYPQHFTRLFKQKVGVSPREYRSLN